jgi:hypothetical protein
MFIVHLFTRYAVLPLLLVGVYPSDVLGKQGDVSGYFQVKLVSIYDGRIRDTCVYEGSASDYYEGGSNLSRLATITLDNDEKIRLTYSPYADNNTFALYGNSQGGSATVRYEKLVVRGMQCPKTRSLIYNNLRRSFRER